MSPTSTPSPSENLDKWDIGLNNDSFFHQHPTFDDRGTVEELAHNNENSSPNQELDSADVIPDQGSLKRHRRPPAWLSDYIYHLARTPPSSSDIPTSSVSSSTRYPIENFVTYDKFSIGHR